MLLKKCGSLKCLQTFLNFSKCIQDVKLVKVTSSWTWVQYELEGCNRRVRSKLLECKHLVYDLACWENVTAASLQQCLSLVPPDEDVLRDEELDKELLWNLQLLSEVLQRMFFLCMCITGSCLMPLKKGNKLLLVKQSKCCMNDTQLLFLI